MANNSMESTLGFTVMEGSPGLRLQEVHHIMIPGRGRGPTGNELTESGIERLDCGAELYQALNLQDRGGVIIPAGYKSPADRKGEPWHPQDNPSETFMGPPEAELGRIRLLQQGIGQTAVRAERYSIDTVTNFIYVEQGPDGRDGYFPDDRPVAIVAQKEHLARMIHEIAPRTLQRRYIGVVAPEVERSVDHDTVYARTFSRAALVGITPDTPRAAQKASWRVENMWNVVNLCLDAATAIRSAVRWLIRR